MIKTIAALAVVVLGAVLAFTATRPGSFHVERSVTVHASAEKLYPLINDLHQFNRWNPYEKKDPLIQGQYRGPAAGPGAAYDFQGNSDVGKGSLGIVESPTPAKIMMKLDMSEPFEAHNMIEFSLTSEGDTTRVTWSMRGTSPFMARLVGIFIDMDRMIGRDFEAGLANLKNLAEKA